MTQRVASLSWFGIVRLGLVQACLGSLVVFVTSTLNRVMVVEYALPAILPGALVALHYAVQWVRPRYGYESDRRGRRTPWILGGMALLAVSAVLCAVATVWMPTSLAAGVALAVVAYAGVGTGVGAAGTSLLVLLAQQVDEQRRAASATLLWILMIAGFAITSTVIGRFLDPYTPGQLVAIASSTAIAVFLLSVVAIVGVELDLPPVVTPTTPGASVRRDFGAALRRIWSEPESRRFTVFVFLSMLAYSAQELLIEPFAGLLQGYSVGDSATLSGLQHGGVFVGMVCVGLACSGTKRAAWLRRWTTGGCVASAAALMTLVCADVVGPAWPLRASVFALGVSNGVFAVSAIGSMMELAHRRSSGDAGLRMGLWGAAQAMAFAIGGLVSTGLVDSVRYLFGSPVAAFGAVFLLEAALFLVAAGYASPPRAAIYAGAHSRSVKI